MTAPMDALIDRARQLTNCWTCSLSGPQCDQCRGLSLNDPEDEAIVDWLLAAPLHDDGTVPLTADGCPGWMA